MSVTACGIVGTSGAGKTQLVERLVPALADRGLTVGYLKHASHGFALDREGTDTDRARRAGATEVVVVGDGEVAHLGYASVDPASPQPFLARMSASDIVLVEGFSSAAHPKIRVTDPGTAPREVAGPVLLDLERSGTGWDADSVSRAADAVAGLVDQPGDAVVSVVADGVEVPMHRFATGIVASTVLGLVAPLKGVDEPASVTVTVRVPR